MRDTIQSKEFLEGVQKKAAFQKQFERPHCIILDSEYCSMGRMIALNACEENGYAYYDAEKLMGLLKPEDSVLIANSVFPIFCSTFLSQQILTQPGQNCNRTRKYVVFFRNLL